MELSSVILLVVGAGCGGVAAALTTTRMERSVVLTEPRRWDRDS
jgi:thioredoxin reductase